jgi:hypothetical protein
MCEEESIHTIREKNKMGSCSYYSKAVSTITSIISCTFVPISAEAATFAYSEALLRIEEFSILPQNPNADSARNALAFTGNNDSVADSNADGTLEFVVEGDNSFLSLDFASDASGNGGNYFSIGQNNAFASNTFSVDRNQVLSFDFAVSLALENIINDELNGSINTFSGVSFALFDETNNIFIGDFRAIGNLDTNLADGIDNDTIFAESNLNFTVDTFNDERVFEGEREFASIDLTGSIQQSFTVPTQVSLQASLFNLSCTQVPQTSDPCIKTAVPESNNTVGLLLSILGIGLFSKKQKIK